jgi:hypothetical protein
VDDDGRKTSCDERADITDANPSRTSAPPTHDYPSVTAFRVLIHSTWYPESPLFPGVVPRNKARAPSGSASTATCAQEEEGKTRVQKVMNLLMCWWLSDAQVQAGHVQGKWGSCSMQQTLLLSHDGRMSIEVRRFVSLQDDILVSE